MVAFVLYVFFLTVAFLHPETMSSMSWIPARLPPIDEASEQADLPEVLVAIQFPGFLFYRSSARNYVRETKNNIGFDPTFLARKYTTIFFVLSLVYHQY